VWEGPFVVGVLAAASGLVAIVFLLGFVRRHTYTPFLVYRLIVAALVLLIISTGIRAGLFLAAGQPSGSLNGL
jgi:undecaprenyl-diphosphatase